MAQPQWMRSTTRAGVVLAVVLVLTGTAISVWALFAGSGPGDGSDIPGDRLAADSGVAERPGASEAPAAGVSPGGGSDDAATSLSALALDQLSLPDAAPSTSTGDESGESDTSAAGGASGAGGSSAPSSEVAATASPRVDPGEMRLQIPGFGVDAPVTRMGVDGGGQMEIPTTASLVAWYGFTSAPGQPGNAVFAAHVNYAGQAGAFFDLHRMQPGDEVTVQAGGEVLRYRVTEAYLVRPEDADMVSIIGTRSGPETITLITCGGEFDPNIRAYERRVIVHAERI